MDLENFDFTLPEALIALRPARPRSAARLLVADGDATHDSQVSALSRWLRPGDMLVFNDTRVIPARLIGERRRETADGSGIARIELTLTEAEEDGRWRALARPAKRLAAGDRLHFAGGLTAELEDPPEAGEIRLRFDRTGAALQAAIARAGVMPLPPYIAARRAADAADETDYQTVFAARPGSVAAPTAALHFDETVFAALAEAGVETAHLTLHVGPGTFLPVKAARLEEHRMHAERGEIAPETAERLNAARAAGGRIIAVGTTALRLLETAAGPDRHIAPFSGATEIFIRPGHRFRAIDGLMTNFHLPKSTLFVLVSALMGLERMRSLYSHAITEGYRFYSYGDASLLMPDPR
ncbi:MAG: tRNA preQ1(34) S-adenosylmethionine ribosyltransferase-isomerase QueA [Pseudomonadota bacterium]